MLTIELPKAPQRESGSNQVTFRVVDDADIALIKPHYGTYDMNIKAGDLLIILEQEGYEEIAEMFFKRHNPAEKYKQGTFSELADLFEHLMGNSDWQFIPQDDEYDLSNGDHMYVDDQGDIRVLTGFWTDPNAWRDDPIEKLFTQGYLVYKFHAQTEFSDQQFFDLPPGAQAAWEAGDYGRFGDIMDDEQTKAIERIARATGLSHDKN